MHLNNYAKPYKTYGSTKLFEWVGKSAQMRTTSAKFKE